MSDFYNERRTTIKDSVAFVAFLLGWFAAAPFAWPYISKAFEFGDPAAGVFRFVLIVFAGGVLFGAVGLLIGNAAASGWEFAHKRWRATHYTPVGVVEDTPALPVARAARIPLPALRYAVSGIPVSEYASLLERAGMDALDTVRVAAALEGSSVIAAWDGDRLVGIARVITDGSLSAFLADLVVDPCLQRRGLGRELLNRAYDSTPRGVLNIVAQRGTGPFFELVGCDRALASFVMRRPAKL